MNSSISWAVLCSLISAFGAGVAIWATFRKKNDKEYEERYQRDLSNEKNFLKLNLKLEEMGKDIGEISRNSDKTAELMNSMQTHFLKIDNTLENHETRIVKLEERTSD